MVFVLKTNLIWHTEWHWVSPHSAKEDRLDVGKILLPDFKDHYTSQNDEFSSLFYFLKNVSSSLLRNWNNPFHWNRREGTTVPKCRLKHFKRLLCIIVLIDVYDSILYKRFGRISFICLYLLSPTSTYIYVRQSSCFGVFDLLWLHEFCFWDGSQGLAQCHPGGGRADITIRPFKRDCIQTNFNLI